MHKVGHIHIISCGIELKIHENILQYIKNAEYIFASKTLRSLYAHHTQLHNQHIYSITAKAKEDAQRALTLCQQGKNVVILASGDALYNGIGGTLIRLRHNEAMTFHPHVTAFQALFHKLALPWSDVALFSVHAQEHIPVRRIASEPFSLTYGGTTYPASSIAKALVDFTPQAKSTLAILAERLGSPEEHIRIDTLEALSKLSCHATSILVVIPPSHYGYLQDKAPQHDAIPTAPLLPLGLPENTYARDNNLITASDVRAVILARLRLPAWGTLWDLGAGSGSIGLEAAALCPHLNVLALEQKEHRIEHILSNQKRMGTTNHHVHHGHALDFLQKLSQAKSNTEQAISWPHKNYLQPDRIFIGGGGADIAQLIELSLPLLAPEGLLVVSAVTLESYHAIAQCAQDQRIGLSSIQMAHEQKIAGDYHALKSQNTIYLFTFCPKKPH